MNELSKKYVVALVLIGALLASPGFAFGRKGRGASFKAAFGMKLNAKDVVALVEQMKTANAQRVAGVKRVTLSKSVTRSEIVAIMKTGAGVEDRDDGVDILISGNGGTAGLQNVATISIHGVTISTPYTYNGVYSHVYSPVYIPE